MVTSYSVNKSLDEILSNPDVGQRWLDLKLFLVSRAPAEIKTKELVRIRDGIWKLGIGEAIHTYLATVNGEIDRRSANTAFWSNLIISGVSIVIALAAILNEA